MVEKSGMIVLVVDSGSGSIKFGEATIDPKTGEISSVDYHAASMPLAADLNSRALVAEIERSGQIPETYDANGKPLNMSRLFAETTHYANPRKTNVSDKELNELYGNKFSEKIKEKYLNTMVGAIKKMQEANPTKKVGFRLIGTAALRKAENAPYLLAKLVEKLDKLGVDDVDLKVISQKDEGIYAFKSAQIAMGGVREDLIIADAGGGSRQFTKKGKKEGELDVIGDTFASAASRATVARRMGLKEGESIYPFAGNAKDSIKMLQGNIGLGKSWLSKNINDKGSKVVGVGNIYGSLLSVMKFNNLKSSKDNSYTKQDVSNLIDLFSNKSPEEVKLLVPAGALPFAENILTNAMLIAATMEEHNMPKIEVVEVSNAQALAHEARDHYQEDKKTRAARKQERIDRINAKKNKLEAGDIPLLGEERVPSAIGRGSQITPQDLTYNIAAGDIPLLGGGKLPPAIRGPQITTMQDPTYGSGSALVPIIDVLNKVMGNPLGKVAGALGLEVGKGRPSRKNSSDYQEGNYKVGWEGLGRESSSDSQWVQSAAEENKEEGVRLAQSVVEADKVILEMIKGKTAGYNKSGDRRKTKDSSRNEKYLVKKSTRKVDRTR